MLAQGRCLHKHGALLCAMYAEETMLIIHVAVPQTRRLADRHTTRRAVSCLDMRACDEYSGAALVKLQRAGPDAIYKCPSTDRVTAHHIPSLR